MRLRALTVAALIAVAACQEFLPTAAEADDLNARLAICRKEARDAAKGDGGIGPDRAYMRYEDCKRREHIEGVDAR